jgi:DNA processing protein
VSVETNLPLSHDEGRAILALSLVADIGPVAHKQLTERFRSASRALDAAFPSDVRRDVYYRADKYLARGVERGLAFITQSDERYPAQLHHLDDPPPVLWSLGDWGALRPPLVSVVGTRRATPYGRRVTHTIVGALARAGATIVSGMALGIDAIAHDAALEANTKTIAVLGTGADVPYPRGHVALHRTIATQGLILSESPPGSNAGPGCFPKRNRIIAALSNLTIVVEAPERSGALSTADRALNIGRDIAAVPGPIDSPQSVGTNRLLSKGAHVITSAEDALHLAGLAPTAAKQPAFASEAERRVWNALESVAASLDDLCARVSMPVAQCMATVTDLEIRGIVECEMTGAIRRRGG